MTTTVKYIVIRDSTNNIVKKQLGEAFPAGQLRSYGNWYLTSYYCYSFNFGGSEWYFGFNMLPNLLCTHTNEGSVKLPVSLSGEAKVGKYDTIGRFTNMLSNWPLAMTMDVPPRTTIYDANAQQYTISYETETLYHYFYYVKFPSNSAKSFSIITPSSDKVSGKGTSSNPWTWSSTENSQKIEIRVRLTDNVKEYISSSTDSRGFSVSSVDKTVSNVKYKYFTVSGFTYAADTVGCLSVDIKQAYTQNVHFTVMYCNGLEVMRPNSGLDNITSANVVSNGQTVGKKYTITTEGVKGSKVYNFTFCAISGSTDRVAGRIFYVESMPNGATFRSSKKDADWQNIKINFQPTCSNVDNNYTISFGEYIYIGIGSTLPTGVKSVALSFTGSTSHSNDFFSPIIGTKNFRLYKEAFYTITAKSDKDGGYYFDNLHGVDGSCPLLQTDSHTTSSRKLDGRGGIIPISVVHYGISVKFSNNSFTSYGSLSIAYGNTWTTNLNTISGNTVKVKYTPKNNQDSINPYAFMLSSVAIEGTATTIPPPSNYVNYNNAAEVSYAIGNTANNIVFVATLTQHRWKVHLNDTQRNSRGNSSIVALVNNIVDSKRKFGDDVYISTNDNIRIDVVPKEHYRLSSITPSNGLVAVAGQTGIATKYKLQKFGNNYIDASVSVLYDRNDHYIVTTSNDSKIQTVRVNNASVNYGYYKKSEYNSVNGRPIVVITTFSGENVGKYKVSSFKLYRYDYYKTDHKGELLYTFSESANEIDKDLTSSSAHVYFTSFYPNAYGVDDFLVESIATSLYDNVKVEVKNGTFTMVNGVEKFTSSTKNFGYIQTRIGDATDTRSDNFTQSIKDGTVITINCGNYYGGILSRIVVKDAEGTHTHNNNPFAYVKLHGEATITVYFCERETFNLLVNAYLGGDSTGFKVGNVVVTSTNPTTDFSVETDTYMITVPLYVGEEYVCTVKPPQDEYFNRRYYFRWWNVNRNGYFDDPTSITENITSDTFVIYEPTKPSKPIRLGANYGKRETASVIVSYAIRSVNSQGLEVITPIDNSQVATMLPGCSFTFENDKYIDSETGKFFTGNDVSIHCKISGALRPYVEQGIIGGVVIYKPMYIKKSVDNPNNYIILSSRDDEMQFDSSFLMQGTIYIQAVFQVIVDRGLTYIKVGFCGQSDSRNGSVSIFSAEMGINYIESNNGSEAAVKAGRKVVLMAAVNPRYFFAGWYADSSATQFISSEPVFEIDGSRVVANTPMYYARYLPSQDSVMSQWNANEGDVKDFLWQSKVFSASSYFSMTSIAVYADNYPVELKFFYSSSPMNIFGDSGNSASIIIYNQNAVRLPKMRPEKYFAFQVKGNARINHVAIGSSMEAIR